VVYNQTPTPSASDLRQWMDELARRGFRSVRTGALGPASASIVERLGFELVQSLALLEHRQPATSAKPSQPTRRLTTTQLHLASDVDVAAFGSDWGIDGSAIADMSTATPAHRMRAIVDKSGDIVGYAVSGRDSRLGFLQRLAVHPTAQRHGIGADLVADSLQWLSRWRVTRVLVNTRVDNVAALGLYHRAGFVTLPDTLRVFERSLS
jgi:ribosomal protein S18 acetylase RimI-like enzyme